MLREDGWDLIYSLIFIGYFFASLILILVVCKPVKEETDTQIEME